MVPATIGHMGIRDGGWGFEEDDDDFVVRRPMASTPDTSDTSDTPDASDTSDADEQPGDEGGITGKDERELVTITVTETVQVLSVRLARNWRERVQARDLPGCVVTAMNLATANALAEQVRHAEPEMAAALTPAAAEAGKDDRPITKEDAFRLMDAVTADLEQFLRQATARNEQQISVQSPGGNVRVTGQRQQLTQVNIDEYWASTLARDTEIQSELRATLDTFAQQASLGEISTGPQSSAISELQQLMANPQETIRRINQPR